jgi:hypothetical protein
MGRKPKSLTVIDGTKPKPAKFVYEQWAKEMPSDNDSDIVWDRFLDREMDRWINGHNGIDGYHYFSLTQAKFKDAEGQEIRPYWRDTDELIYTGYRQGIEKFQDVMYVKRRESGLTTTFGGVVPICNSLIFPGSVNLLTSADKIRGEGMFSEKTQVIYDNLHPRIKPSRISTRQSGFMHFGKKDTKTNELSGLKSQIVLKETVDKPNGLESYRAKSIFIDEYFLHPKANQVRVSAQACVRKGMLKVAPIVLGGSCNETSKEGIEAAIKLWTDAEHLGIVTVFIPGWIGLATVPEYGKDGKPTGKILNLAPNGHSQEKEATEWIMRRREQLDKANDKTELLSFIKEYPLTMDEVFDVNRSSALGPEVMAKLQEQAISIRTNETPIANYDLEYSGSDIVAVPNPRGKYRILEHPQPSQTYIAGTDPLPFNSENLSEGSKYAQVIKKPLANTYVAFYERRELDIERVINDMILFQDYYNQAKTMMENNVFGAIKQAYRDKGRLDLLAKQPNALGINYASKKENYGYYKNGQTAERGVQLLVKYLLKHYDKIYFKEIIDQCGDFMVKNTDLLDAIVSCEFYHEDLNIKGEKKLQQPEFREISVIERDGSGRTVWVTKKIRIK